MTIVMPENVIDTEVYVKTSKNTLDFRWTPGCPVLGRGHGAPPTPLTPRPRKRSGSLDCRRLAEELVSSELLADPGRGGTATGHPDQRPDVTPIILREGHLPQPSKLLRIPGHPHLPKPR